MRKSGKTVHIQTTAQSPIFYIFILICSLLLGIQAAAAEEINKLEILKKVDAFRYFSEKGFVFNFEVKELEGEGEPDVYLLLIAIRDPASALCKFVTPQKMVGQYILMLGDSFWQFVKGMNAPIRISKRQMLVGQVSTGDILRIVFQDMYSVKSYTIEDKTYTLILLAVPNKGTTYDKVTLVIDKKTCKPITAECYSSTEIKLKTVNYTEYKILDGKEILTGLEIINELSKITDKITLSAYNAQSIPEQYYNKNYMKFLKW